MKHWDFRSNKATHRTRHSSGCGQAAPLIQCVIMRFKLTTDVAAKNFHIFSILLNLLKIKDNASIIEFRDHVIECHLTIPIGIVKMAMIIYFR